MTAKKKNLKKKASRLKQISAIKSGQRRHSPKRTVKKKTVGVKRVAPPVTQDLIKKTKIRVIGVGGGGSSIVSEIAPKVKKADFWAVNTDLRALKELSKKTRRFPIGQSVTKGLGTGMSMELGQLAAETDKDKIKKLLQGQDLCIIVASLGGGAGSGAAPVFAKISKSLSNITYGIFTIPFQFEGEKKKEIAEAALLRLKPHFDAISIIPNEKIFQIIDKDTPLKTALSAINKTLAESLESLIETIYEPGLINIDFADLKTVFKQQGKLAYLNTAELNETEDLAELVQKTISNPLYPYTLKGAKGILFNITGSKDLALETVSFISKNISKAVNPAAKIIFGISQKEKSPSKIKITILATGCSLQVLPQKPAIKARKKNNRREKSKEKDSPKTKKAEPKIKKAKKVEQKKETIQKSKLKKKKKEEARQPLPQEKEQKKEVVIVPVAVRKNALQVQKELKDMEKELMEKDSVFETPAFLRRKTAENQ